MSRNIVFTKEAPSPPPAYSQAVKAGGLVFVSGIGPFEAATGKVRGETIEEQTRQCLTNITAILKAAGSSLEKIVSATIILRDESDFAALNEEWLRWFPEHPPCSPGRQDASSRCGHEGVDCSDCRSVVVRPHRSGAGQFPESDEE